MKKTLLALVGLIRHGNAVRADHATHIKHELERLILLLENEQEINIFESLHLIIQNQKDIMDQNKVISDALDNLTNVVNEGVTELKAIAGGIQPGMTDAQAQALADRANALAASLSAVEKPVV